MIKTPLFSTMLMPLYAVFGIDRMVGRVTVLTISLVALLLFLLKRETRALGLVFLALGYTQYHLFHFMHLGLPEFAAISSILVSLYFLIRYFEPHRAPDKWNTNLLVSALFLSLAYYFKIQYLYILPVLPGTVLIVSVANSLAEKQDLRKVIRPFLFSVGFVALFLAIYATAWYLPHFHFYNWVMTEGVSTRIKPDSDLGELFRFNYEYIVGLPTVRDYQVAFFAAIPLFLLLVVYRWRNRYFLIPAVFGLLWFLSELHVLYLKYIPARYYLHFLVAGVFMVSLTLAELINWKRWLLLPAIAVLVFFFYQNGNAYLDSYENRSYEMKAINEYLRSHDWEGETIMGNWAASLAWGTGAKCLSVTWNRQNDKRVFERFQPRMIIAEEDQEDSNYAFSRQDINLAERADSVRTFPVHKWNLKCYWFSY